MLQFMSKYHVFLNSLRVQILDHTHHSSGPAAIHYTAVGLEKKVTENRQITDKTENRESKYRGHSNR